MPIRFRCAYCNQLLGISRRKGGTVVRCPTCAGQVVVPKSENGADASPEAEPLVFERSDFDQVFELDAKGGQPALVQAPAPAPALPPPAGAWGTHAEPAHQTARLESFHVDAPPRISSSKGIFLSRGVAVLLVVLILLAICCAFGAGMMLGSWLAS